jgi:sugar phosphate isomerase/epimerase
MTSSPLTLDRLNIHQVTLNQCDFRTSIECFARHGIRQTATWREKLNEVGLSEAKQILADNGVDCASYCFGGLISDPDDGEALDNNRRWIDEAAGLGARSIVMITGGLPPGSRDLLAARKVATERLAALIPHARAAGVRLAVEPLHPMVCGFRSVISTIDEALEIIDELAAPDATGLAFDTYALWWEPDLAAKIERAAPHLTNLHVSDWLTDTRDIRTDRGMPGDGNIDNPHIRHLFEAAGFTGAIEVEIFSARTWWREDPDTVVKTIIERMQEHL